MSWTASTEDLADWQPSYLAYCVSRGMSPEEVRAADAEEWNGTVLGFTTWMNGQWEEFMAEKGYDQPQPTAGVWDNQLRGRVAYREVGPTRTWYAGEFHPWLWEKYGATAPD